MTPAAARGFPGRPACGTLLERMSLHAQAQLLADAARAAASPWAGPLSPHQHRAALRELGGVLLDLRATAAALAARYRELAALRPGPGPGAAAAGTAAAAQLLGQACLAAAALSPGGPGRPHASVPAELLCHLTRHLAVTVLPAGEPAALAQAARALAAAATAAGTGAARLAAAPGPDAAWLAVIRACLQAAAAPLRQPARTPQARRSPGTGRTHNTRTPAATAGIGCAVPVRRLRGRSRAPRGCAVPPRPGRHLKGQQR
jgi:hypothetical protein